MEQHEPENRPASAAMDALWEWPATCMGLWCEMLTAPWLLVPPPHHTCRSDGEQLAVPEELEEEGERSLFA